MQRLGVIALAAIMLCGAPHPSYGQHRVITNVVYGMYSGLALLLDVHVPEKANGIGVLVVNGSGFRAFLDYGARALKDRNDVAHLLDAGYTLFLLNHRAAPRFAYPAPIEDVQRAARFVRANAKVYGIDANRLGAVGHSSGGYLALMLGVLDAPGSPDAADPVDRESARVQAVVAMAAPTDFRDITAASEGRPEIASFLGLVTGLGPERAGTSEARLLRDASPLAHVTRDDAPMLLMHGSEDRVIEPKQADLMHAAVLAQQGVSRLLIIPGARHGFPTAPQQPGWPDVKAEMRAWLDQHLRR